MERLFHGCEACTSARVWVHSFPRALKYPVLGGLLALGAPAGLLAFRRLFFAGSPKPPLTAELLNDAPTYGYLALSTFVVFVLLGEILGRSADKLEQGATTDPLTHLSNRRHFEERLAEELTRAKRYGSPLAILMIDVDRLKAINDRLGHEAGDAALRRVAHALIASCRETDVAARWGGDEFAVMAPGVDAAGGARLAQRIRAALGDPAEPAHSAVTVSVGVTDVALAGAPTAESLFASADTALYDAKASGRNRNNLASQRAPTPR